MEVVFRNVPAHLTDDALKRELTPFTNRLGITDFYCEKPKQKNWASITFASINDGKKFLNKHEKLHFSAPDNQRPNASVNPRHRRDIARLHILKTAIFVEKSKRPPDDFVLNALKYAKEQSRALTDRNPRLPPIKANLSYVCCGKNVFDASDVLTFVQQTSYKCRHEDVAQFGRVFFTLTMADWRIDVPYTIVEDLIADRQKSCLTFVLRETPRFYQAIPPSQKPSIYGFATWKRAASIDVWPSHSKYVEGCLIYRICLYQNQFNEVVNQLKIRDLLPLTRQSMPVNLTPRPYEVDYSTALSGFQGKISRRGSKLPFVILFQIQSLVSNNYLHPASGTRMLEIMEGIASEYKARGEPLPFTTHAMEIFKEIPYPCPKTEPQLLDVRHLVDNAISKEHTLRTQDPERTRDYGAKLRDHQAWVLKAMVTPSRILFSGPDAESKNRVLRKFSDYTDYFLRVTFCDEDGQDLPYNPKVSNKHVYDRYLKVLKDGIRVAGRNFSFLGFSHSSLRSHSTWFVSPFVDEFGASQNCDRIIKSLGDFRTIRIPAKCAARIGQAFSETPYEVDLFDRDIDIQDIVDVKSWDGSRVFSDGVGTISRAAMEEVWDRLPMKAQTPTCFQIRLGGVKGMLSLDSRLKGKIICIRKESMMKFESRDYTHLGICDTASRPLRMYLNRQTIKILEDMGTDDQWFLAQQGKALKTLRAATATAANTSTFLEYQDVNTNVGLPRLIRLLDKMNIDYRRDEFLKSLVEHVVLRELRLLKHKARIPLDQGVTLFGVMDETGFLKEGEVYVTYDDRHDKVQGRLKGSLKDGPIIVTRSPALHPGDIQCVKMVTPPQGHPLRHLENCIVFSQRGKRDLPSQLSGGDLDGDLYSVIWDPAALPQRTYEPADYPRVNPQPLDREVKREDIAEFFVKFMETDILGLIANRHQIFADIQPEGTLDPICIELAGLHSTAVDYSKTGIPVTVNSLPRATKTRPDFLAPAPPVKLYDLGQIDHILDRAESDDEGDGMGRAKHRFHKSEKVLGRLFRNIDEQKIWNEEISRPISMEGPTVWAQFIGRVEAALESYGYLPGEIIWQRRIHDAQNFRNLYENALVGCMWQFSENPRMPITEVEAFCGSILKKTGSQARRERDASVSLKERIDEVMTWIVKQIRDGTTGGEDAPATLPDDGGERERMNAVELCWACLMVGCSRQDNSSMGYLGKRGLESFRVVAACCLAKELNDLFSHSGRLLDSGGGYLGVSSGGHPQHMELVIR